MPTRSSSTRPRWCTSWSPWCDYNGSAYKDWYNQANSQIASTVNYNWNDPIYEACAGSRSCLDGHWTVGSGARIDFLFFNAAAMSSHGQTVSFNDADAADVQFTGSDRGDLNSSDHRAMSARIHY